MATPNYLNLAPLLQQRNENAFAQQRMAMQQQEMDQNAAQNQFRNNLLTQQNNREQQALEQQQKQAQEKFQAEKTLGAAKRVQMMIAAGEDAHSFLAEAQPDFVQKYESQNGPGSFMKIPKEQLLANAKNSEYLASQALGIMPPEAPQASDVGGFKVLTQGGKVVASQVPERPQSNQMTPYQRESLDLQKRRLEGSANSTNSGGQPSKPLPIGALRLVDDARQAIGTSDASMKLVDDALTKLKSGKVKLGLVNNAVARAQNVMGTSGEASRTYADVKQTFEKLRNNYLLLAKGVQTEGDATRAWNSEIGESAQNDNALAIQQLEKAKSLISSMVDMQNGRIDAVYSNFGSERPASSGPRTFATPEEAEASGYKGEAIIGGRRARID